MVIAGAQGAHERTSGFLLRHQARDSQLAVLKEITCDQAGVADPVTAPAQVARVLCSAREMSLPVYLEFLSDTVLAKVVPVVALPPRHADAGLLAECADEILERIEAAAAPVAVVDVEIRRYGVEVKTAAILWDADFSNMLPTSSPAPISARPAITRSRGWSRTPISC